MFFQVCCSLTTVWNAAELLALANCCTNLANSTCHRRFISDKSHSANDCDWNDAFGTSRKTKAGEVAFRAYLTNKEVSLTATVVVGSIANRQRHDRPVAPLNSSGERVSQGGTTTAERPRVLCPSSTGSNDRILLWAQCNTSTICDRRHRRNAQLKR